MDAQPSQAPRLSLLRFLAQYDFSLFLQLTEPLLLSLEPPQPPLPQSPVTLQHPEVPHRFWLPVRPVHLRVEAPVEHPQEPSPGVHQPVSLDPLLRRELDHVPAVCLTAAFGVNPLLADVLAKDKDYLRYLLLEKRGSNYDVYSKDHEIQIAVGSKFSEDFLYR